MNHKLYVGNLPFQTTEPDLQVLFSQAGTVVKAMLVREQESGRSRGFAFVEMATPEEAQEAIRLFDQVEYGGRRLVVNVARPKDPGERPLPAHHSDPRRGNGRREGRW